MKKNSIEFNDGWCFAIVNGRLAEIHFDKKYGVFAHCYVDKKEYNKSEQKIKRRVWIKFFQRLENIKRPVAGTSPFSF